ncbi:hypothetical protein PRIPAC_74751 [Pristionchus pacificus]|uniref:Uncharacterized protein n=1 Tax=Pristionchus pacificus TaxID=54126 RepID=A0A2A6CZ97_PRIPA|nr:hypothetical protein PRIPAC_74751 [Pristionchus pacificus]|eukprot:PDM83542.1 hypothetical protein PRIPAC_30029 [Pristionchus pacificus]
MGTEAKAYLQEHYIPQLFEGLMTGLIYNRPDDPIEFLEGALMRIRDTPDLPFAWDMFINKDEEQPNRNRRSIEKQNSVVSKKGTPAPAVSRSQTVERTPTVQRGSSVQREESRNSRPGTREGMVLRRQPSVIKAAEVAEIPDVPVILFMGGPGGGKTKIAAKVYSSLAEKYKDKYPDWREANEKYLRGELIPNNLALALVKAEMGRHKDASAFFLEVKKVNMALILDYDERTLRDHMERRGLGMEIIDQIPGEKDEHFIFDRMKHLVLKAIEGGLSAPPTAHHNREHTSNGRVSGGAAVAVAAAAAASNHDGVSRQNTIQKSPSMERASKTPQQGRRSRTPRSRADEEHVENGEQNHQRADTSSSKRAHSRGSRRSQREESASGRETSSKNHERQESKENDTKTTGDERPTAPSRTSVQKAQSVEKPSTRHATGDRNSQSFKGLPHSAPVVLIIGAPGSNKSEYAARVAKKYDGYVLLSMSDLLRKKVAESKGDELWERIGKKMDQGEPVPIKACRELLYTAIEQHQGTSWGYVIVGYPRNQTQIADFESVIGRLDVSILIDCTEQYCTKSVNDRYQKGLTTGTQRADDAADIFKARMGFFKQNTLPMLKYLDDKAKLRVVRADADMVDGDADEDKIFNDITTAIDNAILIDGEASGSSLESAKQP